jgi:hypothetical protein
MDPTAKNLQPIERQLYESLDSAGGIIPQTVEQVQRAESCTDFSEVDLPERLRDPQQVFTRIAKCPPASGDAEIPHVFGQFVSMLRRKNGYSVEALAAKAKVEVGEIC